MTVDTYERDWSKEPILCSSFQLREYRTSLRDPPERKNQLSSGRYCIKRVKTLARWHDPILLRSFLIYTLPEGRRPFRAGGDETQRRGTSDCPWLRRWNAGRTGAIRYLAPASPLEAEQKDIARDNAERVCKIGRPTKAIHSGCLILLAGPWSRGNCWMSSAG
jgi:hypothetical protein